MSQKEVYEFNVPTFGKGVVFDVGHQERAEQFRFFSEALKTARLQTYVQLMVLEAEAFFKERLKGDTGEARGACACCLMQCACYALALARCADAPRHVRTAGGPARAAERPDHPDGQPLPDGARSARAPV
jgi:hypothetical protein